MVINNHFEQKNQQSIMNKKMNKLNKNLMNLFEQKCQFENRYKQAVWTGIWTDSFLKKMNNHSEQKYEQSIWTTIWTVNLSKNFNKNKYANNHFGQNYQQLNIKIYKPSIWTELSTINSEQKCQQIILNKNINNQPEQNYQHLVWIETKTMYLNRVINNQFEQIYEQLKQTNINNQLEQKYQQSILNKKVNKQSEQNISNQFEQNYLKLIEKQ